MGLNRYYSDTNCNGWILPGLSALKDFNIKEETIIKSKEKENIMSKNIVTLTDQNFQKEVLESDVPVLVDFWAPWCAPCRIVAPVVEQLADEYIGKFKIAKLNTDENNKTASTYGIMSIPTLGIFKDGQLVDGVVGAVPKQTLSKKLDEHISNIVIN
jgi:thioredoxin 1